MGWKRYQWWLIVCWAIGFSGCATRIKTIDINTTPVGASVIFDGKNYSDTPTRISVKNDGLNHYLYIEKDGCDRIRKIFHDNNYPPSLNLAMVCRQDPALNGDGDGGFETSSPGGQGLADSENASGPGMDSLSTEEAARKAFLDQHIYFSYNSAFIEPEARRILSEKARWLEQNPQVSIILTGHTDERGTHEYNLALGNQRAENVKAFLVNLGIDTGRLTPISFGEESPASLGNDENAFQLNRRVECRLP